MTTSSSRVPLAYLLIPGLVFVITGGVLLYLGTEIDASALFVGAYIFFGFAGILFQIALIAAAVEIGVHNANAHR